MAGQGDKHSKTEKPTPKRLRDAKREGQIPRSTEVVSWSAVLASTYLARWSITIGGRMFMDMLKESAKVMAEPEQGPALALFGRWLVTGLIVIAPLGIGLMLLGIATNLGQVGFSPSSKLLVPKLSRISPLAGAKRLLSPATIWETVKITTKLLVLAYIATKAVMGIMPELVDSGRLSIGAAAARVAGTTSKMVRDVALAGLVLAGADYGFQRNKVNKQLMMTKFEVKTEHKEHEGDPRLKQAIRSKQLAVSRNRMMSAIRDADVVLVNPTHVAVVLKYDPNLGPPRVVAKGAGVVADKIRERAKEHGVPMVADIPLARTIFRACEIGDSIPAELYDAVARVLAFLFALRRKGLDPASEIRSVPGPSLVAV